MDVIARGRRALPRPHDIKVTRRPSRLNGGPLLTGAEVSTSRHPQDRRGRLGGPCSRRPCGASASLSLSTLLPPAWVPRAIPEEPPKRPPRRRKAAIAGPAHADAIPTCRA